MTKGYNTSMVREERGGEFGEAELDVSGLLGYVKAEFEGVSVKGG